jgi:hypothetical protein
MPHLEDAPRWAAVNPQRLVQRSVERGAVVAELSPKLLFLPGVGEGGWTINAPFS